MQKRRVIKKSCGRPRSVAFKQDRERIAVQGKG